MGWTGKDAASHMCGRYTSTRGRQELIDAFDVARDAAGDIEPDYNVAPTKRVPVILTRDVRELHVARWGLVPPWAKDISIGARMINARLETVHEKPAYRRAFARRRCLLPADGYYEWRTNGDGIKQPYYIRPAGGGVMAMAGLFEIWRPADDVEDAEHLLTCTVITTAANDDVGHIHDRMPMLVTPERFAAWLDPDLGGADEARALLTPALAGRLETYPVSSAVNKVRNNGPQLVKPLPQMGISSEEPRTLF